MVNFGVWEKERHEFERNTPANQTVRVRADFGLEVGIFGPISDRNLYGVVGVLSDRRFGRIIKF